MFFIYGFWYNKIERYIMINPISSSDNKNDYKLKAGVAATTVLTTGVALAHIAKRQGFSLAPSVIKKTPIKDWAIFKLYDRNNKSAKLLELEGWEIMGLASASVAGGLAGGLIFDDKKYRKSKLREAVSQLLGNVAVPIGCVWAASEVYDINKPEILSAVPQFKNTGKLAAKFPKLVKYTNKALLGIPFAVATIVSLGTGIFLGNKVSNFINEKVFHKKVDRKIKGTDFAPHVDDVGMAVSMMAEKSKGSSFITRIIPAFLCVPGYEVGTHRD